MPTRIAVVNRIIITITVKVKSIYGFGVKIRSAIRGNKSTPFGVIVSCIEEIPTCFIIKILTSVSNSIIHREKSVVNNQIAAYPALFVHKLIKKGLKK